MTNPTEAAVEAGARAILAGADIGSLYASGDWEAAGADVQMSMYKAAADALTAALPILHPTIPNTIEALGALPLRSVAQGVDDDGDVVLIFRDDLGDWGSLGDGEAYPTAQAVALAENLGITEWTVLWPLGGAA